MRREIFLSSGSIDHWMLSRQKFFWGLPKGSHTFNQCRAALQDCGFGSAAEIVACAGPLALFRAVVDGDIFYDEDPVWTIGSKRSERWPVRFRFTRVIDINKNWYAGPADWRSVLRDVYLGMRSLFVLRDQAQSAAGVVEEVLYGESVAAEAARPAPLVSIAATDMRRKYPAEFRSDDGHFVRSKSELSICNWLYHHRLVHAYERKLPIAQDAVSDFYIPLGKTCYIEHCGLDTDEYRRRRSEKQALYQANRLNLIELEEDDIKRLDDVLPRKLRQFGIEVR